MKPFKELRLWQKVAIIILMIALGIVGVKLTETPKPLPVPVPPEQVGTVHDYVIDRAAGYCHEFGSSLHYIIPKVKKTNIYLGVDMQYCDYMFYVRCQDDTLIILTSQMFCGGVSDIQVDESLQEKGSRVIKIQTEG